MRWSAWSAEFACDGGPEPTEAQLQRISEELPDCAAGYIDGRLVVRFTVAEGRLAVRSTAAGAYVPVSVAPMIGEEMLTQCLRRAGLQGWEIGSLLLAKYEQMALPR